MSKPIIFVVADLPWDMVTNDVDWRYAPARSFRVDGHILTFGQSLKTGAGVIVYAYAKQKWILEEELLGRPVDHALFLHLESLLRIHAQMTRDASFLTREAVKFEGAGIANWGSF